VFSTKRLANIYKDPYGNPILTKTIYTSNLVYYSFKDRRDIFYIIKNRIGSNSIFLNYEELNKQFKKNKFVKILELSYRGKFNEFYLENGIK
jgi:hypothetical protein